jgi:hypothetical protein
MEQTFQDLTDQGEARKSERVINGEIWVENRPEDNTFKWHDE